MSGPRNNINGQQKMNQNRIPNSGRGQKRAGPKGYFFQQ
jgi:hypothetical protein